MEENKYGRLVRPFSDIEADEINWWQRNAGIEDKFCWVQPVKYSKILRGDYVEYLKNRLHKNSRILELGCGTGWLLFLLFDAGFSNLKGIDFSKEQIRIAEERKAKISIRKNSLLEFFVGGFELLEGSIEKYDVIICHGFLHHLSEEEIRTILNESKKYLNENGLLLIWEPFIYSRKPNQLYKQVETLRSFFTKTRKLGRIFSREETEIRNLIANRHEGSGKRGPSPKEKPFEKNELFELVDSSWHIVNQRRFMSFSHLIGQDLLLTSLTYPKFIKVIEVPLLYFVKFWERLVLRYKNPIDVPFWIFELIECRPKN